MNLTLTVKPLLRTILGGRYSDSDLRSFVEICFFIALPIVRRKLKSGKLTLQRAGMSESELVYDCIGDLFKRDDSGCFVEFQTFFERHGIADVDSASNDELYFELFHLVSLRVGNNLIKTQAEIDPVFSKVLRRLKQYLKTSKEFVELIRLGETCIAPNGVDILGHRPPIPWQHVEMAFFSRVLVHDSIPVMARKLHAYLVEQTEHQRVVPLLTVTLLMKQATSLGWADAETVEVPLDSDLDRKDLTKVVLEAVQSLRAEKYDSYVTKKKVSTEDYEKMLDAVRDILTADDVSSTEDGRSYYDHLKRYMPSLDEKTYRSNQRYILEYLVKLAKEKIKRKLESE